MIAPRRLGGPESSTTNIAMASLTASGTTDRPYFPDPTSVVHPTQAADKNRDLAKSVLEWLFLVVALLLVIAIILRRFHQLRTSNQPMSRFFVASNSWSRRRSNRTSLGSPSHMHSSHRGQTHSSNHNTLLYSYHPYPSLTEPPNAYTHSSRRTRAADLDEGGRRLGSGGANDHDGEPDDKDVLPVYDTVGGPPKYVELEMHAVQARLSGPVVQSVPVGEQRTTGGQGEDAERDNRGNNDGGEEQENPSQHSTTDPRPP